MSFLSSSRFNKYSHMHIGPRNRFIFYIRTHACLHVCMYTTVLSAQQRAQWLCCVDCNNTDYLRFFAPLSVHTIYSAFSLRHIIWLSLQISSVVIPTIVFFLCRRSSFLLLLLWRLLLLSWSWFRSWLRLPILSYSHSMFIYIVDLFFSVCENLCDRQLLLL